jgi:hypothetical protein
MNVIFFDLWVINGALIDALEHFLYLRNIDVDVKLVLFDHKYQVKLEDIYRLIEDRYNVDGSYKDRIVVEVKRSNCIRYRGNTMMVVDWGTFNRLPIIPNLWKNIVVWFDYRDEKIKQEYQHFDRFENVLILKEMPYEYGEEYEFKFALNLYKESYKEKRNGKKVAYLNLASKGKLEDVACHISPEIFEKVIVTGSGNLGTKSFPVPVECHTRHPANFFGQFDTYVYVHDGIYRDPRPRLFHECIFYGKEVIYVNEFGIKDGGYYRYWDSKNNGISSRALTTNDRLIKLFL